MANDRTTKSKSRLLLITVVVVLALVIAFVIVRSVLTTSLGSDAYSNSWLMLGYDAARTNCNFAEDLKSPLKQEKVIKIKPTGASEDLSTTVFAADEENIYALSFPKSTKAKKEKNKISAYDIRSGKLQWEFAELLIGFGAVDHKHMYCVSADPNKVFALDLSNGKKAWESQIGKQAMGLQIIAPVARDDIVYVVSLSGELFALDGKTGKKRWIYSETQIVGSPAVSRGLVFCLTQDKRIVALDAKSGEQKWIVGAPDWKALMNPSTGNDQVYVVDRNRQEATDTLVALDARNGELLWQYKIDKNVMINNLCVSKGKVFLSLAEFKKTKPDSKSQGRIVAIGTSNGKRLWTKEVWGMPAYLIGAGDTLYVSSSRTWRDVTGRLKAEGGSIFGISMESGKNTEEHKIVTKGEESKTTYLQPIPLISNGKLLVQDVVDNSIHILSE